MITCGECGGRAIRKNGIIEREIMTKKGKYIQNVQTYRCENGHRFTRFQRQIWDDSFIEHVVYVYLRCLSLNTTIDIVREEYDTDILTKGTILDFIESVADALPSVDEIDTLYHPVRSGYLAFDGVWFSFKREQIVLLVCFDLETFDIVAARWEDDETEAGYERLITEAVNKMKAVNVKGAYADGDRGFLKALQRLLPTVPFQACVFHKELRMGQYVPVKSVRTSKQMSPQTKHDIKVFQLLFREAIYAETKDASVTALERLKRYVDSNEHKQPERFLKAYRSLAYNFKYTLTHFDHPHMKRDNNLLECFNGILKPRLNLMKSFKKKENLDRYLKLFLTEFRFHPLKESRFKERNGNSPLQLAGAILSPYYNFLRFLRSQLHLSYQLKKS
jgi:transposase-like protein